MIEKKRTDPFKILIYMSGLSFFIAFVLMCQDINPVADDPVVDTWPTDMESIMAVYENGYLQGTFRALTNNTYSDSLWKIDSAGIYHMWDPNSINP